MKPNKNQLDRFKKLYELNCITCGAWGVQIHHITSCGRRLGHDYTIGLCPECHEGKFSIGNAKKSFVAKYGSEMELLEKTNKLLTN